jgi:exodeoxyribonuclease-5
MVLNKGQRNAIIKAIQWYYNQRNKPIFVISGCAGTGKTTIVRAIVECLNISPYQVIYSSFTGKAVEVLRRHGNHANTIHRTFYNIYKNNNKVKFTKKKNLSSLIKLVILDELSMISDHIMDDILSFKIPIIGVGDHCQLPPIYGTNKYITNPDIFLDEIMRQKGDIGILDLANLARNGEKISFGSYTESKVIPICKITDIEKYDVILCWKNITRQQFNVEIRDKLGYTALYPMKGEKLICLKNNYVHYIDRDDISVFLVNGLDLITQEDAHFEYSSKRDYFRLRYAPSYRQNAAFSTLVHRGPFDSYKTNIPFDFDGDCPDDVVFLDFGYAYTVHKSQGSEFDNVLIIDEFRGSEQLYNKWLYTAITRAKKSVTVARYF